MMNNLINLLQDFEQKYLWYPIQQYNITIRNTHFNERGLWFIDNYEIYHTLTECSNDENTLLLMLRDVIEMAIFIDEYSKYLYK